MRAYVMALVPVVAMTALAAVAADIGSLEQQLDQAREAAPMEIKPFLAVKKEPQYFGDYEPRGNTVYKRGEQLLFYGEPKNLVMAKNSRGLYEPAFDVDVEVTPPSGQSMKQNKFMSFKLPTRSRVQDIFLNLSLSLGSAPPGKYNVKFTVRDKNSRKTASAATDITLQ
jgi:hypothetical protein